MALLSSYNDSYTVVVVVVLVVVVVVKVPCHQWPCDARALCLLKPWWAALGSHYSYMVCTYYPDTSQWLVSCTVLLHN